MKNSEFASKQKLHKIKNNIVGNLKSNLHKRQVFSDNAENKQFFIKLSNIKKNKFY